MIEKGTMRVNKIGFKCAKLTFAYFTHFDKIDFKINQNWCRSLVF